MYCSEYFNVFEYLVWTAHEVKKVGRILARAAPKKRKNSHHWNTSFGAKFNVFFSKLSSMEPFWVFLARKLWNIAMSTSLYRPYMHSLSFRFFTWLFQIWQNLFFISGHVEAVFLTTSYFSETSFLFWKCSKSFNLLHFSSKVLIFRYLLMPK